MSAVEYTRILALEGMEEFKAHIGELQVMKARMREWRDNSFFPNQHLLFSIQSGDGCSTALDYLFGYLLESEVYKGSGTQQLSQLELIYRYPGNSVYPEDYYLTGLEESLTRCGPAVVGIHMESWINKLDTRAFRKLLRICYEKRHSILFVFIVPYLEESTLYRIYNKLNDTLNVKPIRFPPYSDDSLLAVARKELQNFGIGWDPSSDRPFKHKLMLERNDGCFFGMQTAMKLSTELILQKTRNLVMASQDGTINPYSAESPDCAESPERVLTAADFKGYLQEDVYGSDISGMEQLESLIGLETVKKRVREIVVSLKAQKQLAEGGHPEEKPCYHMMFTGNPGTGKTEVARIIGRIFYENGLLPVGDLLEVSRFDMVGEWIGQTGQKTTALCRSARGSVLFVDEAYLLAAGHTESRNKDFGEEALGALIAEMENHRDQFITILAGYQDQMEKLFEINSGLKTRIPHILHFENYSREELFRIFKKQVQGRFTVEEGLYRKAQEYFMALPDTVIQAPGFGNARFVRNLAERVRIKALLRYYDPMAAGMERILLNGNDFESAILDEEFSRLKEHSQVRKLGFQFTREEAE